MQGGGRVHRHIEGGEVKRDLFSRESTKHVTWNSGLIFVWFQKINWRELTCVPPTTMLSPRPPPSRWYYRSWGKRERENSVQKYNISTYATRAADARGGGGGGKEGGGYLSTICSPCLVYRDDDDDDGYKAASSLTDCFGLILLWGQNSHVGNNNPFDPAPPRPAPPRPAPPRLICLD